MSVSRLALAERLADRTTHSETIRERRRVSALAYWNGMQTNDYEAIDWSAWRQDDERPRVCVCTDMMRRNTFWLTQPTGGLPLGWWCALHGIFRALPDGTPEPFRAPAPKPPKSAGTRRRDGVYRTQERRQASLFGDGGA